MKRWLASLALVAACGGDGEDPASGPGDVTGGAIPDQILAPGGMRTIDLDRFFTNATGYRIVSVSFAAVVITALAPDGTLTLTGQGSGVADVTVRATGDNGSSLDDTFSVTVTTSTQAVTVFPDADNTLYEEGGLSNGGGDHLFVGRTDGGELRRALLRFDLSAVPAGAVITKATLTLTVSRTQSAAVPVLVHRVTRAWGEGSAEASGNEGQGAPAAAGDATWGFAAFGAVAWTTPGGDFAPSISATASVGPGAVSWESGGLVADVAAWLGGTPNHGWILVADESIAGRTSKRLDSREAAAPGPSLRLEFTAP